MIYVLFLGRGFFENLSLFIILYFSLFIFLYRLCPRDCNKTNYVQGTRWVPWVHEKTS